MMLELTRFVIWFQVKQEIKEEIVHELSPHRLPSLVDADETVSCSQ